MSTIKYITTENHARKGTKTGACVGSIIHNGKLDKDGIAQEIAKKMSCSKIQADGFLSALEEVVYAGLASGMQLDFGPFQICISMKGTLKEANSAFDAKRNELKLFFRPSRSLTNSLAELEPKNATEMDHPWIYEIACDSVEALGQIKLGSRVRINGKNMRIDSTHEDEGVWLESDEEEKLLKATIIRNDAAQTTCRFDGTLATGDYRLALYTRFGGAASGVVAVIRRRVKVIG